MAEDDKSTRFLPYLFYSDLFDLAVNRAVGYACRLGALQRDPEPDRLRSTLELWFLRTRFASRVPFEAVVAALLQWPGDDHRWAGGPDGGWRPEAR